MAKNYVTETAIYFVDKKVFGDEEEHTFTLRCYDGYAVGDADDDEKGDVRRIRVKYPMRDEVMKDDSLCDRILEYRGLQDDFTHKDINYGDIMMYLGKIESWQDRQTQQLSRMLGRILMPR